MSLVARILLSLCVFAGMACGMVHTTAHDSHDECAHAHSHEHHDHDGNSGHPQSDADGDHQDAPHHHDCCHYPSADRPMVTITMPCFFLTNLVEIPTDRSLVPEEPLFLLDKPPLI